MRLYYHLLAQIDRFSLRTSGELQSRGLVHFSATERKPDDRNNRRKHGPDPFSADFAVLLLRTSELSPMQLLSLLKPSRPANLCSAVVIAFSLPALCAAADHSNAGAIDLKTAQVLVPKELSRQELKAINLLV